ncbi:MAG: ABC transporter ATP-binding protein [Acidobacteriota bacterium]|nr:ABC transporter ATP-binding protein [Acidobacteriota bacterium]
MNDFALDVQDLVKIYPGRGGRTIRAVDGMSFKVRRGSIFGLLGPNGAGKTTLLKTLTTLLEPTSGTARIEGFDVVRHPLEVRRRIALVLQETAVELFLSVRDNLLTYARFRGLRGTRASQRVDELLGRFHLESDAGRKAQDLSGGTRRRVQVAKVFLADTPVVFLDEFSTGMDPHLKRAVMEALAAEAAGGRTIVLTTQVLGEAEELCDDILIMNRGREAARGDLHTLKLLSAGLYEIAVTFDRLPATIEEDIARLSPLRARMNQNTVELAVKAEEAQVLEIVTALAKRGRALHVEVSGASLEDVFVQLTGEPGAASGEEER